MSSGSGPAKIYGSSSGFGTPVAHLNRGQLERLTQMFKSWRDAAPSPYLRRVRGRYWLAFLLLRFTGARIGEVLSLDDSKDIDYINSEVKIVRSSFSQVRSVPRSIPVPNIVVVDILSYIEEFPKMRGKVFRLDQGNFRRKFYKRADEAEIPRNLSHPHILRHTRAMEMIEAGVPLNAVQQLLGHALSSTTAVYLRGGDIAAKKILKDKGLL